jgi:hypothetical protein
MRLRRRAELLSAAVLLVASITLFVAHAGGATRAASNVPTPPPPTGVPPHPLATSLFIGTPNAATVARMKSTGITFTRLDVVWHEVAPKTVAPGFDPTDPGDPQYSWGDLDNEVKAAVSHGLTVFVTIYYAPDWAQNGPPAPLYGNSYKPDAKAFAEFALAVARRYSGTFHGLPRVRYFQAWNEPNISLFMVPQLVDKKPFSPGLYRRMLNGFADAVHSVHADNVVVTAGLAPFRDITGDVQAQDKDWGPLSFMRALLCLGPTLKPICHAKVKFDVWAQHPYTSGGPLHHAVLPNDVSLGDLPKVVQTLAAAERAGNVVSTSGKPKLWATEFSWDSNPPDPRAVPMRILRRWVPEALYQMWLNGVSLVNWLQLDDGSLASSYYQGGLYFVSGKPKPLLESFRFPFVAYRHAKQASVWGRTPFGKRGSVVVEQHVGTRWRSLATLRSDRYGIFRSFVPLQGDGAVRARILGDSETSTPFSLTPVPDHFYNPFGSTTLLEPKRNPKK